MSLKISKNLKNRYEIMELSVRYLPKAVFLMVIVAYLFPPARASYFEVGTYLISGNSPAVTVSTVLIGIYLTLYTLMLTSDSNSIFSILKEETVKFIERKTFTGIIVNMLFILASLLYPLVKHVQGIELITDIGYFYILDNFFTLSFYYVISLGREKEIHADVIKQQKRREVENDLLIHDLKKALNKCMQKK